MKVHILVTQRNDEQAEMAKLVFRTLRVGFPTADVVIHFNKVPDETKEEIIGQVEAETREVDTIHHEWIYDLVHNEEDSFWICDTDVIFYDSVEGFTSEQGLMGCLIPEWEDEFSGCLTKSRLHPSLLRIDPNAVRRDLEVFFHGFMRSEFTPVAVLTHPQVTPSNGKRIFHDTCSYLYHAIGGQVFTDEQRDAYFHFHFGTISDVVLPRLTDGLEMEKARRLILEDPGKGKGMWRAQDHYFESRRPGAGANVIEPIKSEDAVTARQWNYDLCCGNAEAMAFNDLWYNYCHGIDDLIDTMRDGRPTMCPEEMLSLFIMAIELYNCPFWKRYGDKLHAIVVQITNDYADSVEWEKSGMDHRRKMSDVLRMAGNDMYCQVAYICGGRDHMRRFSKLIKERDWLGQHDHNGNPT